MAYQKPLNTKNITARAIGILQRLNKADYEAYLTGQTVRELFNGRKPTLWIIHTNAAQDQIIETLDNIAKKTTLYRRNGIVQFELKPYKYNIIPFAGTIEEELAKTNFTINAMAYNPDTGLIDPFGGHDDVTYDRIVTVHETSTAFAMRPIYILQAMRLESHYYQTDDHTAKVMAQYAYGLQNLNPNRIYPEFIRFLTGGSIVSAMMQHDMTLAKLIPELAEHIDSDAYKQTLNFIAKTEKHADIRMAILLRDLPLETRTDIMKKLGYQDGAITIVNYIIDNYKTEPPTKMAPLNEMVNKTSETTVMHLLEMQNIIGTYDSTNAQNTLRSIMRINERRERKRQRAEKRAAKEAKRAAKAAANTEGE